jgi:hypothetical protein
MQRISVAEVFAAVCASYYPRRFIPSSVEATKAPAQST